MFSTKSTIIASWWYAEQIRFLAFDKSAIFQILQFLIPQPEVSFLFLIIAHTRYNVVP